MNPLLTRRRFLAATAMAVPLGGIGASAAPAATGHPTTLIAARHTLEVLGKPATVLGVRQPDDMPGLVATVDRPFRVHLENHLSEPTLIHWHGLKPPYRQDGVPGISAPPIAPGGSAEYDFPLDFPGTFWMHSHMGFQEQRLLDAPLIIHSAADLRADRQEIVLLLHDFSFKSPRDIFAALRKRGGMAGMGGTGGVNMGGHGAMGGMMAPGMKMGGTTAGGMASGMKAGSMAMDLNDVVFDAFLANDRTLADPQVVRVAPGGRLRLRIINAAAASNFRLDLGGLAAELVAVDGHPVQPVRGSAFPIAMAQRLDLLVQLPPGQGAHPVLAVLEGERKQTGIILATAQAPIGKIGTEAARSAAPLGFGMERALHAAAPLAPRPVDRTHRIDLTGSMEGYVWSLNGVTYGHDTPLMVAKGERVALIMRNRTMMSHPMHLHGHFFQVAAFNGAKLAGAMRDTVLVPPMATVAIAFDADNPGRWAFHCHNLYHMQAGMMTTVQYTKF